MSRLDAVFGQRAAEQRTVLVMYLMAGDPAPEASLELLNALVDGGADVIELGYPHSDPVLDGPILQESNSRAIQAGATLSSTLELLKSFRAHQNDTPVILMGYYHPIVAYGIERFVADAAACGADGVIIPDLPLETGRTELLPLISVTVTKLIPLSIPGVAAEDIFDGSPGLGGFVYCVPQAGPTGGPAPSAAAVRREVAHCRSMCDLPVVVGFGIKTPVDAVRTAKLADGVVVASAFVEQLADWTAKGKPVGERTRAFAQTFRYALDSAVQACEPASC